MLSKEVNLTANQRFEKKSFYYFLIPTKKRKNLVCKSNKNAIKKQKRCSKTFSGCAKLGSRKLKIVEIVKIVAEWENRYLLRAYRKRILPCVSLCIPRIKVLGKISFQYNSFLFY